MSGKLVSFIFLISDQTFAARFVCLHRLSFYFDWLTLRVVNRVPSTLSILGQLHTYIDVDITRWTVLAARLANSPFPF